MNYVKKSGLALAIFLSSALLTLPVMGDDTNTDTLPTIQQHILQQEFIGSWIVTIDDGYKSPSLFSFLPGGVITQSESPLVDPLRGNLAFSPAHGTWEQNADGSFTIRYFKQAYDADGSYVGLEETNGLLALDTENNLSGELTVGKIRQNSTGANEVSQPEILFSGSKIRIPKQ